MKRSLPTLGIRSKLALPLLLGFFILVLIIELIIWPTWEASARKEFEAKQRDLLHVLSISILPSLLTNDYASLYRTLNEETASRNAEWLHLAVHTQDGKRIYPLFEQEYLPINNEYLIAIKQNISMDGTPIGKITLQADQSISLENKRSQVSKLEQIILGAFLVVLIVSALIQTALIRRPIKKLELAAQAISSGDYDSDIAITAKTDEIGMLAKSLQEMRTNLSRAMEERETHTKQIKDEQAKLHAINEAAVDAFLLLNSNGEIISSNRTAKRIFPLLDTLQTSEKPVQFSEIDPRNQKLCALEQQLFAGAMQSDAPVKEELSLTIPDMPNAIFELSITPFLLQDEKHYHVSLHEITRQKQLQNNLLEATQTAIDASNAKSDFLAKMSHEIRTPLNGVLGFTQLLAKTSLNDMQKEYVSTLTASGETLLNLINDILDFSKIEAGEMTLESIPFELCSLVKDTSALLRSNAKKKNLFLQCETEEISTLGVAGDPTRLRQVILNLVGNAIKFTESGGVSVALCLIKQSEASSHVQLTIEDTGIGIPEEAHAQLFNPFKQADDSTTRKYGGSGLGLSICKQLIELMGGSLSLHSKVGHGSSFVIDLAMKNAELPKTPNNIASDDSDQPQQFDAHVLLVDDVPVNQLVGKALLEGLGMKVTIANNGLEALDMLNAQAFDLIFMDCEMPEMDGYEASREIRKSESDTKSAIPIIAMTANAYEDNYSQCIDAGMSDFITKPVAEKDLIHKLQLWLNKPQRS